MPSLFSCLFFKGLGSGEGSANAPSARPAPSSAPIPVSEAVADFVPGAIAAIPANSDAPAPSLAPAVDTQAEAASILSSVTVEVVSAAPEADKP